MTTDTALGVAKMIAVDQSEYPIYRDNGSIYVAFLFGLMAAQILLRIHSTHEQD